MVLLMLIPGCVWRGVVQMNHLIIYSCIVIFFGTVWHFIYRWLGISAVIPFSVTDHFNQFSYSDGISKVRCSISQVIWFATV